MERHRFEYRYVRPVHFGEHRGMFRRDFLYVRHDEDGTRPPALMLALRSGTCRDYALLMMEASRCLGFAARFVSGHLYDETRLGTSPLAGGGETDAWLLIYLRGAGWVEFDPTKAITAGRDLIRVSVAHHRRSL